MQGFIILALLSLAEVGAVKETVTPVQKVVEMLNDMMAKGKKEKQDETVRFTTFKAFCENTEKSKTAAITKAGEDIETLTAGIEKADADALELGNTVSETNAFIDQATADLEKATAEREAENKEYEAAHSEYVAAVAAVKRAIELIKSGIGARAKEFTQVAALLQVHTKMLPDSQREALENWLGSPMVTNKQTSSLLQDAEAYGYEAVAAPEAHAYEDSSGGVLDTLEKLGDKFQDETDALERAETNARANYGMFATDLKHQIATATDKSAKKSARKAERESDSAQMTSDKDDTAASKAADEKYLEDLLVECKQKSFDYSARQKVRQGEIEAIGKAIEIMTSDALTTGSQHVPGLIQKATSLAQLRSSTKGDNINHVVTFLMRKAGDLNSKMLMLLAQHAQNDPFKKVKKMIKDMIFKLQEEANEEAEHKGFCDTEMSTNEQTRNTKSDMIESLKADIEEYTADIAKLADEISKLQAEISEIDKAVAEATMQRRVEKGKNMATIADSEAAEEATARALAVLKEFYAKAAVPIEQPAPQQGPIKWDDRSLAILKSSSGGASLLQVGSVHKQPTPEMEEGQYTGMGNGGVLGLLEVIQSDFARVISETRTSEADAQHEFDTFSADSAQDKAVKEADVKHKENVKVQKTSALGQAQKDLRVTDKELTAAMDYYEKLKPSCVDNKETYAQRVARRNEEIQSLKEAVEILESSTRA